MLRKPRGGELIHIDGDPTKRQLLQFAGSRALTLRVSFRIVLRHVDFDWLARPALPIRPRLLAAMLPSGAMPSARKLKSNSVSSPCRHSYHRCFAA